MDPSPVGQPDGMTTSDDSDEAEVNEEEVIESIEVDQLENLSQVDHRNGNGVGPEPVLANGYHEDLNLSLELSPLEQSAPRRYIRIAMAMNWDYHPEIELQQQDDVYGCVSDAFLETIERWPYLSGSFFLSDIDAGMLQLRYPERVDKRNLGQRVHVRCIAIWDPAQVANLYHLEMSSFGRNRFRWGGAPILDGFPPVTANITFDRGAVIIGWSFSEAIFDGEAIRNFFDAFILSTHGADDNRYIDQDRTLPTSETDEVNLNLFPCFDWSGCAIERRTPQRRLRSKVFIISAETVAQLYCDIRRTIYDSGTRGFALFEDCVFALFWVAIMRARFQNGRIHHEDKVHVFYSVPGAQHTRMPPGFNYDYCGNTTVTPVATLSAEDLIRPPNTHMEELRRRMNLHDLALAGQELRDALQSFRASDLSQLVALKRTTDPVLTLAAHERALRRHTDCLAFEDWTTYSGNLAPRIPWTRDRKACYFPCFDDLQEGTVIILPRKYQYYGHDDWNICVCLAEDDMNYVTELLERDVWWSPPRPPPPVMRRETVW
ncbi:hypothetical protein EDB81DRAFT_878233 [Dactylonectria macrodidyma]|uniref:Uncharacterized protein n=1 Tax=Dactylonectria macrodidyma TaxID=307937 RepID=A0A9P9FNY2_9HYPO|nr:hypothetical protein EDB81DRAFT_878233 [Dactylonectria macrodidyma]